MKSLLPVCPLLLWSVQHFFRNCLLAFPGFFHSSSLARCQRTQDQYLTVNVVEPHKLSKIFCITIAHNSKKARQLKSVKSL